MKPNYRLPEWQALKNTKPMLTPLLLEVAIAMVLTDASMGRASTEALMKIGQGYKQKDFVVHLWNLFSMYCWGDSFHTRMNTSETSPRYEEIKSYWFKTFSHRAFTQVYNLCYLNGKKTILPGIIQNYITGLGLAYMIMSDGSLSKNNNLILHLQGFSKEENMIVSNELNNKFGLHSTVISHKVKYFVVRIPAKDAVTIRNLIAPHMLDMFTYKIPRV